jgi:hypothetical protein
MALTARQRAFLSAYARVGTVAVAARTARVGRASHYVWLKDATYQVAFTETEEVAVQYLEDEARRRAMEGIQEPVIYQGALCFEPLRDLKTGEIKRDRKGQPLLSTTPLTIPRKSDNLLMFLLKALRPEVYREHVKVAAAASAPPRIKVVFPDRDKP